MKLINIPNISESNGSLAFAELGKQIPFEVKRFFYVYGVRGGDVRGQHAHRKSSQFLICPYGLVTVTCDDGTNKETFYLDSPSRGLLIPPMIWAEQLYNKESVLMVLSDTYFDEADYIRDYSYYKELVWKF